MPRERVAVYVDGFNLYHALDDLQDPRLKWLNLKRLADLLVSRRSQQVVLVRYFTAFANHFAPTSERDKLLRHRAYVAALAAKGVQVHLGTFAKRDRYFSGRGYKARWRRYEEKQTDVAIGVRLLDDAYQDRFDRALVVGVDSDLVPAFAAVRAAFPQKSLVSVAPPKRAHHRDIQSVATDTVVIKVSQVEKALFGERVVSGGRVVARRPAAYRP